MTTHVVDFRLACHLVAVNEDGPLALARRQLENAVAALADPLPVWDGGVCRWSSAVYTCLRRELSGGRLVGRGVQQRSRLPCRLEVLALLIDIDATVAGWEPHGKGTLERLHQLAGRGWRPQDVGLLERYRDDLQRWAVAATELLAPTPRVFLPAPCPRCAARFAYHRSGAGERVRTRALQVAETGCQCSACGAFWGPDQFHWLARLLGCEPLPA